MFNKNHSQLLDYFSLPENPVVFDVGGYMGDWTYEILKKNPSAMVYIFEPVVNFYNDIKNRYKDQPNVRVFNFGLSDKDRDVEISVDNDSSSVFKSGNKSKVVLKSITNFLLENEIFHVDIIKINIEGEEYRLLEYLSSIPELNIFDNFLVQYHRFIENYEQRREDISKNLTSRYNRVFNYDFIFEGWSIKDIEIHYCFGDSHSSIFTGEDIILHPNQTKSNKYFNTTSIGPVLAYNAPNKGLHEKINKLKDSDNVIVCLGEIDCRAQVHRRLSKDSNYKMVIDDIIENYLSTFIKTKNHNIKLFSVTPPLKERPHWNYYKANPNSFDSPCGTIEERVAYKKYFNKRLEEMVSYVNIEFISIYDELTYKNGTGKEIFYKDDIHLNPARTFYLIKRKILKH